MYRKRYSTNPGVGTGVGIGNGGGGIISKMSKFYIEVFNGWARCCMPTDFVDILITQKY